jgi:hypothetical protein
MSDWRGPDRNFDRVDFQRQGHSSTSAPTKADRGFQLKRFSEPF